MMQSFVHGGMQGLATITRNGTKTAVVNFGNGN